jgi:hypothetical protein
MKSPLSGAYNQESARNAKLTGNDLGELFGISGLLIYGVEYRPESDRTHR